MRYVVCLILLAGCEFPDFGGTEQASVPASAYCAPVENWSSSWVAFETEVLELVNDVRAQGYNCGSMGSFGPAAPVESEGSLVCAARVHSKDMGDRDYFSHNTPEGVSPFTRMANAGFSGTGGENIAWGQTSPQAVMDSWLDSDGHCSNIMEPSYKWLGVGYYEGNYWTQNFGR